MLLEQLSHSEHSSVIPGPADAAPAQESLVALTGPVEALTPPDSPLTADTYLTVGEQPTEHHGLLRRLGAAATRQLGLLRQYGPAAYFGTYMGNSTERAGQLAKEHPRVAAAAAGVAIGSLGAKFGYDLAHQAMAGHADISTIAGAHAPSPGADILNGGTPPPQHANLTAFYTKGTHHPDILHATSPYPSKDYASLHHGYSHDIAAMKSDATRAQAAGDLRVIYPDGYLPNGQPVDPGHYWYSVKETIIHNGKREVVWTTDIHKVLPTLAAHSDGARTFAGSGLHPHPPRHFNHPNPPHHYRPPQPPAGSLTPPVTTPENGNDFWHHKKLLALAGASVVTTLAANLFVLNRLRKNARAQAAPVERAERIIPASASAELLQSMESHGITEVTGRHGAPVALDEQDASIVRPRIGTGDFSAMASTTITAQTLPGRPGIVTLRLGMTDGRRIGAPLVDDESPSGQTRPGYVALTCTIDSEAEPCILHGETTDGQLEALALGEHPTRYYVNLLADILTKDIANATSRNRKVREQAESKVSLTMAR